MSGAFDQALEEFNEAAMFQKSIQGAHSAWRGFELQTLYICSRVLCEKRGRAIFMPESVEDLLVYFADEDREHVELVQVKAKNEPLTLSDIAPKVRGTDAGNEDSLMGHIRFFLERGFEVSARVVVFGELGEELKGFDRKNLHTREAVLRKIETMYGANVARFADGGLSFEAVNEGAIREELSAHARGRPELSAWPPALLHHLTAKVRECSRLRECIAVEEIEDIVKNLGLKLAGLTGLAKQYGNTITPYSSLLRADSGRDVEVEYREGVNARPEHIAAGLDIVRARWMQALDEAFSAERIVVVRGASGQGKSTLCYRYLHDRVDVADCHVVTGIDSVETARDVCAFIVSLCSVRPQSLQYVYLDGAMDDGWAWLAEQVYTRAGANVRLLVSMREEDYTRSNVSRKSFRWRELELRLDPNDAKEIYDAYASTRFPSFEESWKSFGGSGPLMEYTYSLGTGSTLRGMLEAQARRIVDEHNDSWVYALYLASLIGAEGLSCSLHALAEVSGCENMGAFVRSVDREHLLRATGRGSVGPLHPRRSHVLASILEPHCFRRVDDVARGLVRCAESSCGTLLVNLHMKRGWRMADARPLIEAAGTSWSKLSEIVKYALWSDTRRVYDSCAELRERIGRHNVSSGLLFAVNNGITNPSENGNAETLLMMATEEHWHATLEELIKDASVYKVNYADTTSVLDAIDLSAITCPSTPLDLTSAGFVFAQFYTCGMVSAQTTADAQRFASEFSPYSNPLSSSLDFAVGIQLCGAILRREAYSDLEERIDSKNRVVWRRTDGTATDLLQIPYGSDGGGNSLNDELVAALADYRRLYPCKETYCGAQIGADALLPPEKMLSIEKHIPAKNLPIRWTNIADILFYAMCDYDDALADWNAVFGVVESSLSLFKGVVEGLSRWLNRCFEKGVVVELLGTTSKDVPKLAKRGVRDWTSIDIPKADRDPYGFKRLNSPVDPRSLRVADSASVKIDRQIQNPLHTTYTLLSTTEAFGQRCCELVIALGKRDNDSAKCSARLGIALLKTAIESLRECSKELKSAFGKDIGCDHLEMDMLVLAGMLGKVADCGIRRRRSMAYDSKLRARRIMNAPSLVADMARKTHGVTARPGDNAAILVAVELTQLEPCSIEGILARSVRECFGDMKDPEHLMESFLFPHYCPGVEIDLLYQGAYLGSYGLTGHQLQALAGNEEGIIIRKPIDPVKRRPNYSESPKLEAIQRVVGIRQTLLFSASVRQSLLEKDPGLLGVDEYTFNAYRREIVEDLEKIFGELKFYCRQLPQGTMDDCENMEWLEASVRNAMLEADVTSTINRLDAVLAILFGNT